MKNTLISSSSAALLLIAASAAPLYAADPAAAPVSPSVQDIVNGLKSDDGDASAVRTRSLRPGAAASATAAAPDDDVPTGRTRSLRPGAAASATTAATPDDDVSTGPTRSLRPGAAAAATTAATPDDDVSAGSTRSLRPGGAAAATAAAAPADEDVFTTHKHSPQAGDVAASMAGSTSFSMQIEFESGSDRIASSSRSMVDNLAAALSSPDLHGQSFTIVGHTDGRGAADYNLKLSQRRAVAVRAYLVKHGVAASRLKATGKGMTELVNSADPGAAENRRVEIIAGA